MHKKRDKRKTQVLTLNPKGPAVKIPVLRTRDVLIICVCVCVVCVCARTCACSDWGSK